MRKFVISDEAARRIAVGLHRKISAFILAADPLDFERFKAEHEKKTATQNAPKRQRRRRNPVL